MRTKQKSNPYKIFTIAAIGDSQTDLTGAAQYGVPPYRSWPCLLSARLNASGCKTKPRVFGRSGDTLAAMVGRSKLLTYFDKPEVGIIYGGVNDVSASNGNTAASGSASTITLHSSASDRLNAYLGQTITITSGTGSGQSRTIIAYTTDRIATVDTPWNTNPNGTSVYTIAAPTQAQMQANFQALIKILKYGAKGLKTDAVPVLWSQSQLPVNGLPGVRYVVMNDNSTTGGRVANGGDMNATITGNYSASPRQSVWEYRNPRAGESGWGRVAIAGTPAFSDGVDKIIIVSTNYLNYSSGGDNFNVTNSTGTQYVAYVPVRAASQAAATAESVVYCDLYALQSLLINGGQFLGNTIVQESVQSSYDWHFAATDQHHNAYGHETIARALEYVIVNQNWIPLLS